MIGHLISGAGALGVISTALAIKESAIPPTINYENPDPLCDLDYVPNTRRRKDIRYALVNSFGFGGQNACIDLNKYEPS